MAYTSASYSGRFKAITRSVKPLWTINYQDEDELLEWAKDAIDALADEHKLQTEQDLINRDFYMGLQSSSVGKEGIPRDREGKAVQKFARVVINHCYELIEQWVSKMTRYAPAIAVIPPNQEYNDRIAAEMSKSFIDYLFYQNDIDDIDEEAARCCRIDGESFVFVRFEKSIGDLTPQQAQADQLSKELGVRIPLLDPQGQQVLSEAGDPLYIEKKQRVGDLRYEVVQRRFVLLDPKARYADCNWMIVISTADVDELRSEFPERADDIDTKTGTHNLTQLFEASASLNEVMVFEIFHKGTQFLDSGRYIKFIDGAILENTTMDEKFGHTEFPCARITNIDIPGILRGMSFLEHLKLLNVMYNNLASIAYTNMALGAHIYWLVDRNSNVDLKKIRNGASALQFTGVAPKLERFQCIGEDVFKMMEFVDQSMLRMSGIQGVSRGEPPQGIEAGVALAFLEEQENQRANTDIKKHNAFIKKLARLSLATAGAFYDPNDGRTIRIVGKNNQFSIKALDVAKLGGPYDIRVQRTTALSESKAGRLSQILAIQSRFPDLIPREQVMDMLELANNDKYYKLTTVAVEAQERENELMAQGTPAADAAEYEEHLVHWYSLRKYMQSAAFKEDMPPERKQLFITHGMSHEYFMHAKAATNPVYAQQLATMYQEFPVFTLPGQINSAPLLGASGPVSAESAQASVEASPDLGDGGPKDTTGQMPAGQPTGDAQQVDPTTAGQPDVGGPAPPQNTAQPPDPVQTGA